jgi:hypothetical protein
VNLPKRDELSFKICCIYGQKEHKKIQMRLEMRKRKMKNDGTRSQKGGKQRRKR